MAAIWTMGEILVEIMRPNAGMSLYETGIFRGPFPSGAPAIFIDTAARLGHKSGIIGGVGKDDFGRCVIDRLSHDGVDTRFVGEYEQTATAVAFVTYFEDGSRRFIYHIDGTPAVMNNRIPDSLVSELSADPDGNKGFFHIMGCSLLASDKFRDSIIETMETFIKAGYRISFDPNIRKELLADGDLLEIIRPIIDNSSIILPGIDELKMMTNKETIDEAVSVLFSGNSRLEIIVLKKGKNGAAVFQRDKDEVSIPVYKIREVDPTGAGDSFDAGFLCGIIEGKSVSEAGRIAAAAGALNASAFGPMEGEISADSVRKMITA